MYSEIPEIPATVLVIARIILSIALLLSGWRLFRGPSIADRIISMELVAAILMAHFIVQTLKSGFISYLDVALAIAIISFLGTVAFARYVEKREEIL